MVRCPYCNEYESESSDSVRGHIRAKTDPEHKGKSGFESETEQTLDNDPDSAPDPEPVAEQTLEPEPDTRLDPEPDPEQDSDRDGLSGIVIGILVFIAWRILERYTNEDTQDGVRLV